MACSGVDGGGIRTAADDAHGSVLLQSSCTSSSSTRSSVRRWPGSGGCRSAGRRRCASGSPRSCRRAGTRPCRAARRSRSARRARQVPGIPYRVEREAQRRTSTPESAPASRRSCGREKWSRAAASSTSFDDAAGQAQLMRWAGSWRCRSGQGSSATAAATGCGARHGSRAQSRQAHLATAPCGWKFHRWARARRRRQRARCRAPAGRPRAPSAPAARAIFRFRRCLRRLSSARAPRPGGRCRRGERQAPDRPRARPEPAQG